MNMIFGIDWKLILTLYRAIAIVNPWYNIPNLSAFQIVKLTTRRTFERRKKNHVLEFKRYGGRPTISRLYYNTRSITNSIHYEQTGLMGTIKKKK